MNHDYIMERVKKYEVDIASVVLKGSRLDDQSVDFWSDTDVVYVLKDEIAISVEYVEQFLVGFGEAVAVERYMDERCCLIRGLFVLEGRIEEWDILIVNLCNMSEGFTFPIQSQVIFGEHLTLNVEKNESIQTRNYDVQWVDSIWYKLFASVKRICRKDNLIGLHLLLDVYRDLLVIKMVDRDVKLNTNIHRFGSDENIDDLVPLNGITIGDVVETVDYLQKLGKCFDDMMIERFDEYRSRYYAFEQYSNQSITEVKQVSHCGKLSVSSCV